MRMPRSTESSYSKVSEGVCLSVSSLARRRWRNPWAERRPSMLSLRAGSSPSTLT